MKRVRQVWLAESAAAAPGLGLAAQGDADGPHDALSVASSSSLLVRAVPPAVAYGAAAAAAPSDHTQTSSPNVTRSLADKGTPPSSTRSSAETRVALLGAGVRVAAMLLLIGALAIVATAWLARRQPAAAALAAGDYVVVSLAFWALQRELRRAGSTSARKVEDAEDPFRPAHGELVDHLCHAVSQCASRIVAGLVAMFLVRSVLMLRHYLH